MLTCRDLTELVTNYLERRLSWRERLQVELHLGMCRDCRAYLHQMRETIRTLHELPPDPVRPDVRDKLLERFRNWKPQ
jgi:predicted anti-sigma-YlaC factor YlaD